MSKNDPNCMRHLCPDCGMSLHTSACNLATENNRLLAENERLRAALNMLILEATHYRQNDIDEQFLEAAVQNASAALKVRA